jgi:hypothetical protein
MTLIDLKNLRNYVSFGLIADVGFVLKENSMLSHPMMVDCSCCEGRGGGGGDGDGGREHRWLLFGNRGSCWLMEARKTPSPCYVSSAAVATARSGRVATDVICPRFHAEHSNYSVAEDRKVARNPDCIVTASSCSTEGGMCAEYFPFHLHIMGARGTIVD